MLKHKTLLAASLLAAAPTLAMAGVAVTPNTDADALVNALQAEGSGITIMPGSASYIGGEDYAGFFSNGLSSGLGIDQGIVLATGFIQEKAGGTSGLILGPNSSSGTSANSTGAPDLNDSDLADLIGVSVESINDGSILEFQFTTTTGNAFFNYVFGSEEYNEFVDSSFNDVFGFFLDGENVALLTDGTPVSINNVNNGKNADLYNDNTGSAFDLELDGFTNPLQVKVTGLDSGVHTLALKIADVSDSILGSAVFIEGGSFSTNPVDPGEPTNPTDPIIPTPSAAMAGLALLGTLALRRRR